MPGTSRPLVPSATSANAWPLPPRVHASSEARTNGTPPFAVDREDRLIRHRNANHRRETIAFSPRDHAVIERAAVQGPTRDFGRPVSVNHDPRTPAMNLGRVEHRLGPQAIRSQRLFPGRVPLPGPWEGYSRRRVDTPEITHPRRHTPERAF